MRVGAILHQRSCGKEVFSPLFWRISTNMHRKMGMKTGVSHPVASKPAPIVDKSEVG